MLERDRRDHDVRDYRNIFNRTTSYDGRYRKVVVDLEETMEW